MAANPQPWQTWFRSPHNPGRSQQTRSVATATTVTTQARNGLCAWRWAPGARALGAGESSTSVSSTGPNVDRTCSSSVPATIWTSSPAVGLHRSEIRSPISTSITTCLARCAGGLSRIWESAARKPANFSSSDDVELLLTLANYVGIAIENTNSVPLAEREGG